MTMQRQRLRGLLRQRVPVRGCTLDYPSTALAHLLARHDFGLIVIDCEHGGPGIERVGDLCLAAAAGNAAAVVRPWSKDPGLLRRYLDCGVDGVIWPEIEGPGEVDQLRSAFRATAPDRADSLLLIGLVETPAATGEAAALAAHPGLDGLLLGPGDLAVSCGHARTATHPELDALHRAVLCAARDAGTAAGGPAGRLGAALLRDCGATLFMYSAAELLRAGIAARAGDLPAA